MQNQNPSNGKFTNQICLKIVHLKVNKKALESSFFIKAYIVYVSCRHIHADFETPYSLILVRKVLILKKAKKKLNTSDEFFFCIGEEPVLDHS